MATPGAPHLCDRQQITDAILALDGTLGLPSHGHTKEARVADIQDRQSACEARGQARGVGDEEEHSNAVRVTVPVRGAAAETISVGRGRDGRTWGTHAR